MPEIVRIADHLVFATGLGDPEKARPYEERVLYVAKAAGFFGDFTRLDINLDRDSRATIGECISDEAEKYLHLGKSVALCGFSVGGSASLLEYIKLKRELPSELVSMLSVYLVASRVRGLERINKLDYVKPHPQKSFSTEQGYRNLLQIVGEAEGIAKDPNLALEVVSGIHVIRGESDDRMSNRDTRIRGAFPSFIIEGADTHIRTHARFCERIGPCLAAAHSLVAAHVAVQLRQPVPA